VLVIVGLIVGGLLVGQDLVSAAAVRAQVTQIEGYNTAATTFRLKFGYLPGDIPDPYASQFGFAPRGQYAGEGDGNGVLEGNFSNAAGYNFSNQFLTGEIGMFWVDLGKAGLISENLNSASPSVVAGPVTATGLGLYFPAAKLGSGNYVYDWSGGINAGLAPNLGDGRNYFGIAKIYSVGVVTTNGCLYSDPGMTVAQAYSIDKKLDDGLPQSGNVTARYIDSGGQSLYWAGSGLTSGPAYTTATSGSSATCFDNGAAAGARQQYSMGISKGSNVNCALVFLMQGAGR
jgi:hypothetical protein